MKVVVTAGSRSTSAYSGSEEPRQVVLPGFWSAAGVRRRSFRAGLAYNPEIQFTVVPPAGLVIPVAVARNETV